MNKFYENISDALNMLYGLEKDLNIGHLTPNELKVFYRDCGSRRTFDINTECQGYHTGGNKKISKKIERYLLKQK